MFRAFLRKTKDATSAFQQTQRPVSSLRKAIFGPGEPVTYAGVTIHKPPRINHWAAEFVGAQLWFWFMFRAYHDWEHHWYGLANILDKELEAEGWDPETSDD